jgi:hypothetical protein
MKLTIADRLNIAGILPPKGNMVEMAMTKEINEKLVFDTKEIERIGLVYHEDGKIQWKDEFDKEEYDIDLKPKEIVFLDKQVSKLDSEGEISRPLYNVCKKIQEEA